MSEKGMVGIEGLERYRAIGRELSVFGKEVVECYHRENIERIQEIHIQCEALRAEQDKLRPAIQEELFKRLGGE